MATDRLSDSDKDNIESRIISTMQRALYNKRFPVEESDAFDWLTNQMEPTHREAYMLLRKENNALITSCGSWHATFYIKSLSIKYHVGIHAEIPVANLLVAYDDPYHDIVVEWLDWYHALDCKVDWARKYCRKMVYSCTSVGQIKRLFPAEALRFVPSHLCDFSQVERRSRIPASFAPDPDKLENMMNIVTLGAISPEAVKGCVVTITSADLLADTI